MAPLQPLTLVRIATQSNHPFQGYTPQLFGRQTSQILTDIWHEADGNQSR